MKTQPKQNGKMKKILLLIKGMDNIM